MRVAWKMQKAWRVLILWAINLEAGQSRRTRKQVRRGRDGQITWERKF